MQAPDSGYPLGSGRWRRGRDQKTTGPGKELPPAAGGAAGKTGNKKALGSMDSPLRQMRRLVVGFIVANRFANSLPKRGRPHDVCAEVRHDVEAERRVPRVELLRASAFSSWARGISAARSSSENPVNVLPVANNHRHLWNRWNDIRFGKKGYNKDRLEVAINIASFGLAFRLDANNNESRCRLNEVYFCNALNVYLLPEPDTKGIKK
jgi:hypothetical protein